MNKTEDQPPLSLSDALHELEAIAQKFEHGEFSLEQGLESFSRGKELAKMLQEKLGEIENEIQEIKTDE